jgi:hypothetical protein
MQINLDTRRDRFIVSAAHDKPNDGHDKSVPAGVERPTQLVKQHNRSLRGGFMSYLENIIGPCRGISRKDNYANTSNNFISSC